MVSKLESKIACVVIPAYNEESGIRICVEKVVCELRKIRKNTCLIVINDGSQDNTAVILKEEKVQNSRYLFVYSHKKNRGYGSAIQTGIKKAHLLGFKYVIFMDSDLTNNPKYLSNFFDAAESGYDCIKASRYITGGRMKGVPFHRQIVSIIGNRIASSLFNIGIQDCTNGFRMVKVDLLRKISYTENGFPIIMEELYHLKRMGASFSEIPNVLTSRNDLTTNFQYTFPMYWNYLKYALKASMV